MILMRKQTCCFTGHRIIPCEHLPKLAQSLENVLRRLIAEGICYFGTGGALGFDTLAADTVLRLHQQYPQIRLILVLPCRDQTRSWRQQDIEHYEIIKFQADKTVYTSNFYTPDCMHRRNRHLIDNSSVCVAYCTRSTGGSAYTVNYARQKGVQAILLP